MTSEFKTQDKVTATVGTDPPREGQIIAVIDDYLEGDWFSVAFHKGPSPMPCSESELKLIEEPPK